MRINKNYNYTTTELTLRTTRPLYVHKCLIDIALMELFDPIKIKLLEQSRIIRLTAVFSENRGFYANVDTFKIITQ